MYIEPLSCEGWRHRRFAVQIDSESACLSFIFVVFRDCVAVYVSLLYVT
jgi:hypothetical protein